MSAQRVHDVLTSTALTYNNEDSLQAAICDALEAAGLAPVREVKLTGTLGRIDLMCGDVGIEVKIDGQLNAVTRQLMRYTHDPRIRELVLVTTRAKHHQIPEELNGKAIHLVSLIGAAL